MLIRVFLAGLSSSSRKRWKSLIKGLPALVSSSSRKTDVWKSLCQKNVDLILIDRELLSNGFDEEIGRIRKLPEKPELIVLTTEENSELRAHFLAAGCLAVLNECLNDDVLREALSAMIERRREQDLLQLQTARVVGQSRLTDFISASPAMQVFMNTVQRVVTVDTPLLLCGETGVGKERLASAIHSESSRAKGPFIVVNCGALPEGLVESELFGHEEGAFTGASRARRGHFELAHQGTIFLDEIGEMPIHLQVKLLRVLQERTIQRVGAESVIHVDVRVIAATNRDLATEMEANRFRRDLFYRLAVVTLTIPPLRERQEDIPALLQGYLEHFRSRFGKQVHRIAPDAYEALIHYSWPGNVRELINIMERAILLSSGEEITVAELPDSLTQSHRPMVSSEGADSVKLPALGEEWLKKPWKQARQEALEAFERQYLIESLKATGGKIGTTAKRAAMDPRSLYEKMKFHNLRKQDFQRD